MSKFKVGDLVSPNFATYLKMSVTQVFSDGTTYKCMWMENAAMKSDEFPEGVLTAYEEPQAFQYPKSKGSRGPFRNLR